MPSYAFTMCDDLTDLQIPMYVWLDQDIWRMGWSWSRSQNTTMSHGRSKYRSEYLEKRMFMDQVTIYKKVTQEVTRHNIEIIRWPWSSSQNTAMSHGRSK
jgi:hypothetical protein